MLAAVTPLRDANLVKQIAQAVKDVSISYFIWIVLWAYVDHSSVRGTRWVRRPIEELELVPNGDITWTFMCHVSYLQVVGLNVSSRLLSVKGQSEQARSGMDEREVFRDLLKSVMWTILESQTDSDRQW